MPLFEYVCTACGKPFEVILRAGAEVACPACASTEVERQLSVISPVRKGGFPFKPGPPRPMGAGMPCGDGGCGMGAGCDPDRGCAGPSCPY
ncbi:MAG: zinc ribbon domain-containing protein [Desulfovibrio sp.]|jgi:putative FmdB family regulatory protein|nr:zinc ribbon domain-containing protein [Desulfovibrio sp.]